MKTIITAVAVILIASGAWASDRNEGPGSFIVAPTAGAEATGIGIAGASATGGSVKSDIKVNNTNLNAPIGIGGQGGSAVANAPTNIGMTANPNLEVGIKDESIYLGDYPTPYTTPMPAIQPPTIPKTWQLSISMWDSTPWPYESVVNTLPEGVEVYGRCFREIVKAAKSVATFKTMPANGSKVCSYVVVAKSPIVDATVLEDAAMLQVKSYKAGGLVEKERHFNAKNNAKGSSGGAGIALSILGSILGNIAQIGPYAGAQTGSYVYDQDIYAYLAFDVIELR